MLEKDRTDLIDAFVNDLKTYTVDDWQVFDITAIPTESLGDYGVQAITNLYSKYSKPVKVLAVVEAKEKGSFVTETVERQLLPSNLKSRIISGKLKFFLCFIFF